MNTDPPKQETTVVHLQPSNNPMWNLANWTVAKYGIVGIVAGIFLWLFLRADVSHKKSEQAYREYQHIQTQVMTKAVTEASMHIEQGNKIMEKSARSIDNSVRAMEANTQAMKEIANDAKEAHRNIN